MSGRNENLYDSLPRRPLVSQISSPQIHPTYLTSAAAPPLPPPRRTSIPADSSHKVTAPDPGHALTETELNDLLHYLESPEIGNLSQPQAQQAETIQAQEDSTVPFCQQPLLDKESIDMKRGGNSLMPGSPVPKPRSSNQKSSMKRSRSCDQLAEDKNKGEKKATESHRKTAIIPGSDLEENVANKLVMVAPPVHPGTSSNTATQSESQDDLHGSGSGAQASNRISMNATLASVVTEMGKSLPLRIEMLEGYMSSTVPSVTFSSSDIFNVHLIKQQEVVRVRDSVGQIYSIPLYSSIQIGLVNDTGSEGSTKKSNTLQKTVKAGDIMAMKSLPIIMCATKTVKSTSGEKFSVEEKEVLLVKGVSKVPGAKKKKLVQALEVYSITKKMEKVLFQDCAGHFSLSPSLTRLPMSNLFKHIAQFDNKLPLQAFLFFKPEDISNAFGVDETIPPPSLSQNVVTVEKKVLESALIMSPYLESEELDVTNSENLLHVIIDDKFGAIEVSISEVTDHADRSKLYNNTCAIHDNIDLSRIKYYHSSASALIFYTQAFLYGRCQSKKLGVKMDLPTWSEPPITSSNSSASFKRKSRSEKLSDYKVNSDLPMGQRQSEAQLTHSNDSVPSSYPSPTQSLPPSLPSRSLTPHQAQPIPLHSASSPALPPPTSHRSPPHPSQPHLQGSSIMNSPSVHSQLLTSITQRTVAIKDGSHRRFSDIDVNSCPHERQTDGADYSPRPDRKVRKSNSVKDTTIHGIANRPPYPTPSAMANSFSEISSKMATGRENRSYRIIRSNESAPNLTHAMTSHDSGSSQPNPPLPLGGPPIPPRDLPRKAPESSGSRPIPARITRQAYENRVLDSPRSVPNTSYMSNLSSHVPSPYLTPQNSGHLKPSNEAPLPPGVRSSTSPKPKRQAPEIPLPPAPGVPLPQLPNNNKSSRVVDDDDDDDDDFVYEEMKSIHLPHITAPKPSPIPRKQIVKDDDYEGIDPSTLMKPHRSGSDGYEIFNPPTSTHVVQEMNVKIQELKKEVSELKESCSSSVAKIEVLEKEMKQALATINELNLIKTKMEEEKTREASQKVHELSLSTEEADQKEKRHSSDNDTETNKVLVQNLTCDELKLCLEGLGIRQYNATITRELVDGKIFTMLDEATLQDELGVASRLHRVKMLNLIQGCYNPEVYLKNASFQQTTC